MKLTKIILRVSLFFLILTSLSCDKDGNPVTGGKILITISENPVTIAVNYYKYLSLTGGTGRYYIISISDSTIVTASINTYISDGQIVGADLQLRGDKVGNTKIVVEDSAKTAKVEVFVTVQVMSSSVSSVTVKSGYQRFVSIYGGTYPYSISSAPNNAVATVVLSSTAIFITGVAPGQTSVTISDNATPKNSTTITITVPTPQTFTTAGKISFSSSVGDMAIEGIYGASDPSIFPPNDVGVGGFVTKYEFISNNTGQLIGYKKKSITKLDIVFIYFSKSSFSPEIISLDTTDQFQRNNFGMIFFGFDVEMNIQNNVTYASHNGTLEITQYSEKSIAGKFSGSASQLGSNGPPLPGNNATFSSGVFDMPLIVEEYDFISRTNEEKTIFAQIEKMVQPHRERMIKEMEKKMKR